MPTQILPATRASPRTTRPFELTRFFSVTSLIGILVVTASLIWVYRELAVRHLIDHETRANVALTRAFANTVWSNYRDYVAASAGRSREQLVADPMVGRLRAEVLSKMNGLQVAKIKIYNLQGITVFSTDEKQIGEDKSSNAGLQAALNGEVASNISFRERFDAFEGVIANRNLIASYVPARHAADGPIEGAFEVYSDVTELLDKQEQARWQVAGLVLVVLSTLYAFLFFIVRKADRIIARQRRERDAKEEEIRHQAYHDPLTGLPNRAYFAERLQEVISMARRHDHTAVLMFIDLDRFKIVNDSLGHQAGDSLLQIVAERIRSCLREHDLLFRMGGDEFTVILPVVAAPEDAAIVARRITETVARAISIHEHELSVGATIGIAVFPGDGDSADALLKNADAAMYSTKENSRGGHSFYRAAMNQRASERLNIETALQKGFRNGEFALYYQPRVDTASRRVVALEALLRWIHPTRGVVPPGEFIGVLEETRMMIIVGEWVLRTACLQLRAWCDEGIRPLRVSVNVSPVQFENANFVAMVRRVVEETGVDPSLVELELTESLLIDNLQQAQQTIESLKRIGLHLSIDDFGTGYSSLNYLRLFSVDYLKIDRSFVTEIASSERGRAVATAIGEMARALDITVVAEGVETEAQARFFSGIHCGELQGFLFSRPLPAADVRPLLSNSIVLAAGGGPAPRWLQSPEQSPVAG